MAPRKVLVSSIDYNDYVGRIAIGRIERGVLKQNQEVAVVRLPQPRCILQGQSGLPCTNSRACSGCLSTEAKAGDIVCFLGHCGHQHRQHRVRHRTVWKPLPFVKISEPTVEMTFSVNDSPFAGREGKFVTSRQIRERLMRELLRDVSLRVEETDSADSFRVLGRGEMHLVHPDREHAPGGLRVPGGHAQSAVQRPSMGSSCEPIGAAGHRRARGRLWAL